MRPRSGARSRGQPESRGQKANLWQKVLSYNIFGHENTELPRDRTVPCRPSETGGGGLAGGQPPTDVWPFFEPEPRQVCPLRPPGHKSLNKVSSLVKAVKASRGNVVWAALHGFDRREARWQQ